MTSLRVLSVLLALLLAGCVDLDPLEVSVRQAAGPYNVVRGETGYELIGPAPRGSNPEHGAGRLAGEPFVGFPLAWYGQEDGWIVGGGLDEGWLVIDATTCGRRGLRTAPPGCHVEGPLAEGPALLRAGRLGVTVRPVASAWGRLLPTPGTLVGLGAVVAVAALVLGVVGRRLFATPPRPGAVPPPEPPFRPAPLRPALVPAARPALPVAAPAPVVRPEGGRPEGGRPGRVRWPVPGLERPLMAAEYGARYGLPADEVVILVQRGVLPGCKYLQRWYAEDVPPPDRLAAIGAREAERRAREGPTPATRALRPLASRSNVHVATRTDRLLVLRITGRLGADVVLGALLFLFLLLTALGSGSDERLWFAGLCVLALSPQAAWQLRGWEEVAITPDRLTIRRRVFATRVLLDAPLPTVHGFDGRWWGGGRSDQRRLSVLLRSGRRVPFGNAVADPLQVADLLNARLRAFTAEHGPAA